MFKLRNRADYIRLIMKWVSSAKWVIADIWEWKLEKTHCNISDSALRELVCQLCCFFPSDTFRYFFIGDLFDSTFSRFSLTPTPLVTLFFSWECKLQINHSLASSFNIRVADNESDRVAQDEIDSDKRKNCQFHVEIRWEIVTVRWVWFAGHS